MHVGFSCSVQLDLKKYIFKDMLRPASMRAASCRAHDFYRSMWLASIMQVIQSCQALAETHLRCLHCITHAVSDPACAPDIQLLTQNTELGISSPGTLCRLARQGGALYVRTGVM